MQHTEAVKVVINMLRLFKQHSEETFKMYLVFGKRLFDIIFSILAAFFLAPLLIIIAILIGLFDSGPIIFRQKRVGLGGALFDFYKFRSMPVNTGDIPSSQIGQVRLTWIGQMIRRTSIDELPQLVNILKGDMSVVGPRPPIESQTELLALRRQNGALSCRPGLTGLAQISSFSGMKVFEKAYLDAQYVKTISFKNDLLIIFKTFAYLLKPPPVY